MKRLFLTSLAIAALSTGASRAGVTYSFSDSASQKSASAAFSLSGTTLTVVVTNTGAAANDNPDTLGGIFLNLGDPTKLQTADTIALTSGSQVITNGLSTGSQDVDGQWFKASDTTDHAGYNLLLSSVGYNSGTKDYFGMGSGDNGINYGLIDGIGSSPKNGFENKSWISNSVTLTLTVKNSFSLSDLGSQILFQYGSDVSKEPSFVSTKLEGPNSVPEPGSLTLAVIAGSLGLAEAWRRRKGAEVAVRDAA